MHCFPSCYSISALTFILKLCLERSKSCSSWFELKIFNQLFKLKRKKKVWKQHQTRKQRCCLGEQRYEIQIKITLKWITFWWALEEITSSEFICMHLAFSKFTALLWIVGRKLNSYLLSVKSELLSYIVYMLSCSKVRE